MSNVAFFGRELTALALSIAKFGVESSIISSEYGYSLSEIAGQLRLHYTTIREILRQNL